MLVIVFLLNRECKSAYAPGRRQTMGGGSFGTLEERARRACRGVNTCFSSGRMDEQVLFRGKRFHVVRIMQAAENGPRARDVVRHGGSVTIIPLVDDDHVCLIRNFRVAVGRALIELPAGTREPGEPVEATARRELTEETGYRAARWEQLPGFYLSPGILDERMELFLARDLTAGERAREAGEEIENLVLSWAEIDKCIASGEIEDAKTLVGLCHARRRLRS